MHTLSTGNRNIDDQALDTIIRGLQASKQAGLSTVMILCAIAPLLGLLGTITGMIATFEVVSNFGLGNARAIAEGISEAMITTRTGLIVAIPGLLLAHFIRRNLTRRRRLLTQAGLKMLNRDNNHEA